MQSLNRAKAGLCLAFGLFSVLAPIPSAFGQSQAGVPTRVGDGTLDSRVREFRARSDALPKPERDAASRLFAGAFEAFRAGELKAAQAAFERGLAQDPANGVARYWLAETFMRLNDTRAAREQYQLAAALNPHAPEGQKAQAALASLPAVAARTPPQLPVDIPPAVKDVLLTNPLFTSLPDSRAMRCTRQRTDGQGRQFRFETTTTGGTGGFFSMAMSSTGGPEPYGIESFLTLGGIVSLTSTTKGTQTTTAAITKAEGRFYPLKRGNWFRIEAEKITGTSRAGWSQQCEVHEVVPSGVPGLDLPQDDVFRVACTMTWGSAVALSSFRLCSNIMGICPVLWPAEAGEAVPSLSTGFTYARRSPVGTDMWTETSRCEP